MFGSFRVVRVSLDKPFGKTSSRLSGFGGYPASVGRATQRVAPTKNCCTNLIAFFDHMKAIPAPIAAYYV
jgi:hypothetical protein